MQSTKTIILFFVLVSLFSCRKKAHDLYKNADFNLMLSISQNENRAFCIVLTDSNQVESEEYLSKLNTTYKYLIQNANYNILDLNIDSNSWYKKWLNPISLPVTCIFSSNGKLIDLIPGYSKETFLYSQEAIKNSSTTEYQWPNRFGRNKNTVLPWLDQLLKIKLNLAKGVYHSAKVNGLMDSLNYPYAIYMVLLGEKISKNHDRLQSISSELLRQESAFTLSVYRDEFIEAKTILNPDFNAKDAPSIRVDTPDILLKNCKVNQKSVLNIPVYNDGEYPLKIESIEISCTCLELLGKSKDIIIAPKESHIIRLYFTPHETGQVARDLYIASNAINKPLLHINILAETIENK